MSQRYSEYVPKDPTEFDNVHIALSYFTSVRCNCSIHHIEKIKAGPRRFRQLT